MLKCPNINNSRLTFSIIGIVICLILSWNGKITLEFEGYFFEAGILTGQFMRNYTNRNIKAKRFKIMDHPWTFLGKWSFYWSIHS